MSIFEYDEEATLQYIREDEYSQGMKKGLEQGIEQGLEQGIESIIEHMLRKNLSPEDITDMTGSALENVLQIQQKIW